MADANTFMKCWICGDSGMTGEHKTKRSDLRSVFGAPTQAAPLYFHDQKRKNRPIGSLDAKILRSPSNICAACNNARTQRHDRAWERMSTWLRTGTRTISPANIVRANRIFPYDTDREMCNVHLYFLKLFGCHIVEGNIPIEITAFANAILTGTAHPNVHLRFCRAPSLGGQAIAGMSNVEIAIRTSDGTCAFASWFYYVGRLAVNVMFAADGEQRQGLVGAWHPRSGTNRLVLSDLD